MVVAKTTNASAIVTSMRNRKLHLTTRNEITNATAATTRSGIPEWWAAQRSHSRSRRGNAKWKALFPPSGAASTAAVVALPTCSSETLERRAPADRAHQGPRFTSAPSRGERGAIVAKAYAVVPRASREERAVGWFASV